jgi:adenylylsulfate kinase
MSKRFPVVWLTGNTGAGKTTLATGLQARCEALAADHPLFRRVVMLDGDEMRASISLQETLSPEDRRRHNLRVARLAEVLQRQGFLVIVSVIAPFAAVRAEIDELCRPLWMYVKRSGLGAADKPYEEPLAPHLVIDNDALDIEQARQRAFDFLQGIAAAPVRTATIAQSA